MKNFVSKALWLFKSQPKRTQAIYSWHASAWVNGVELAADGYISTEKVETVEEIVALRAWLKQYFIDGYAEDGVDINIKCVSLRSLSFIGDVK